ncbi:MAG: ribosome assembly factor SBDS [Candidatus Woesearchaeota archaeon]
MEEKLNLARIKKEGHTFEISVDPDLAVKLKRGGDVDLREVLKAEKIFSDARKGELVSEAILEKYFKTVDPLKIAEIIIRKGEIQLTSEYRAEQREQKIRKLIELIHRNAVDPHTKLPLPITRIENAFAEAKVHLDEYKPAEEQLDEVVSKLRPVLAIKFEQANLVITIPSTYTGKAYSLVQKNSKLLKEDWNSDGSWTVLVEIPAGLKLEFIEKLNSLTHGEVIVTEK